MDKLFQFLKIIFFTPTQPLRGGQKHPQKPPLFVNKCQKVYSIAKNDPMMIVYGSLEAYGQVVSFFEDFFHPPRPPQGGQKHPNKRPFFSKNVKKVYSVAKNGPMMMVYGSIEAYGQVVSFFEEFLFHPPRPSQGGGGQKHPQNAPFCQKMSKTFIA